MDSKSKLVTLQTERMFLGDRTDMEFRKHHLASKYKKYWEDKDHRERHRKACRDRYRTRVGMLVLSDVQGLGRHVNPATGRQVSVYRGDRDDGEVIFYMSSGTRVFIEGKFLEAVRCG